MYYAVRKQSTNVDKGRASSDHLFDCWLCCNSLLVCNDIERSFEIVCRFDLVIIKALVKRVTFFDDSAIIVVSIAAIL